LEEIKNGMEAQQKTLLRFFKLIDNDQWKSIESNLLKYCHNDVRAMISIYFYLLDIKNKIDNN
jgi:hypothetical protein